MSFTYSKKNIYHKFTQEISPDQTKLLIVEGNDDLVILEELCRVLSIEDMHFHCIEGKEHLPLFLDILKNDRSITSGKLNSIGIVLDADKEHPNVTFQRVVDNLRRCKFEPPSQLCIFTNGKPKIGVYILPDSENQGTLENLLLQSVTSDQKMACVDTFYNCAHKNETSSNNSAKIKARAFVLTSLSSNNRIFNSLGQAAKGHKWDFSAQIFSRLKDFLLNL